MFIKIWIWVCLFILVEIKNNLIELTFAVNIFDKNPSYKKGVSTLGMVFRGEFLFLVKEKIGDYYPCLTRFGFGYIDSYWIDA